MNACIECVVIGITILVLIVAGPPLIYLLFIKEKK